MKHNKAENNSNNNNFNPPLMVLHLSGCDECVECEFVCVIFWFSYNKAIYSYLFEMDDECDSVKFIENKIIDNSE